MWKQILISIRIFVFFSVLTGLLYPFITTGVVGILFKKQAEGSLIEKNGEIVGSRLIGQNFDDPKYFWSRPSATSPAYNASSSSGSNLGPMNEQLQKNVEDRIKQLQAVKSDNTRQLPIDLVTASASGLDPHISLAAALYQMDRIAQQRNLSVAQIRELIMRCATDRFLGLFGEPVVNVLELNLLLDRREAR